MSYLCRCVYLFVVGMLLILTKTGVFSMAFQQAFSACGILFNAFFHNGEKYEIFLYHTRLFCWSDVRNQNFPQSFPHLVENCLSEKFVSVIPFHFFWIATTFQRQIDDIFSYLFCHTDKFTPFFRFFMPVWWNFLSNQLFHTTFPQGVGNPCGKVRPSYGKPIDGIHFFEMIT